MEISKTSFSRDQFRSPRDQALYLTFQIYGNKRRYLDGFRHFKRLMKNWKIYHNIGFGEYREWLITLEENPQKVEQLKKQQLEMQL